MQTARPFPTQNLEFMCHYCWSFCWFNNFWEELRILMQPHYLWNYLEREFSRAERGRLRSDLFSFSLRFLDLKRIQKPPKVPFWLKAKCESFKMNLMMSLSLSLKRVKIFLSLRWWVLVQLEILRMKRKMFLLWNTLLCLDVLSGTYFSPFIALNIKTTPCFPPPLSRVQIVRESL